MTRTAAATVRDAAAVMLGGMIGTLLREAAVLGLPRPDGIGVPLLAVNLIGSAALGFLVAVLPARLARLRLLLGTGLIGGFTSYSAFALDLGTLFGDGRPVAAVLLAAASVLGGLLAAAAGLAIGRRCRCARAGAGPAESCSRPRRDPDGGEA